MREWNRGSVYECTRKYWRISKEKAKKATLCIGIYNGKVVGVFKPEIRYVTEEGEYTGRMQFEGKEIEDSPYLEQDFSFVFEKMQNPVRYMGIW